MNDIIRDCLRRQFRPLYKNCLHIIIIKRVQFNKCLFSAAQYNLEEPSADILSIVSHAAQSRLTSLTEKLSICAEHRVDQQYKALPGTFSSLFINIFFNVKGRLIVLVSVF